MSSDRPVSLWIAEALLVLAAFDYAVVIGFALMFGGFAPTALGGTTVISVTDTLVGYGPLVALALAMIRPIRRRRQLRGVLAGFAIWLGVALLDGFVLGPTLAAGIVIMALIPFGLVVANRERFGGGGATM